MGLLQMILKLFGLGEKFKIENIIKSVLLGGKGGAAAAPAGGGAAAPAGGPSIGLGLDKLKDMFASKGMGGVLAS